MSNLKDDKHLSTSEFQKRFFKHHVVNSGIPFQTPIFADVEEENLRLRLLWYKASNSIGSWKTPDFSGIEVKCDVSLIETECNHDLKDYHGFTESYKYCTKCDHKESV